MIPIPTPPALALACLLVLFLSRHEAVAAGSSASAADAETAAGGGSAGSAAPAYRFVHKTIIIPDDTKISRGGEDAASTIDDMLVVADGVGGWAQQGVDPGLYSRKLVETITTGYAAMTASERAAVDLKRLVHKSNHVAADAHLGSATCTVVRLKDAVTLEAVNVGDSGYSIHRRGAGGRLGVAYASVPGQRAFNFPYQLGGRHGDGVYDPGVTDGPRIHALEAGDVIVLVSDGVNDNMDPGDYHACIERYQWGNVPDGASKAAFEARRGSRPTDAEIVSHSAAADCIARTAYFLGKNETFESPFARSAASYGKRWSGGKEDDITVVVAQVEVGAAGVALAARGDDPHRPAAIFLYGEADVPVPGPDALPAPEEALRAALATGGPSGGKRGTGLRSRLRSWVSKLGGILRRRMKPDRAATGDLAMAEL